MALFSINKHSITFDTDGGTHYNSLVIEKGHTVSRPADPVKEGFEFDNWYTTSAGDELFDFNKPIETNTTIFARYTANEYTIVFITDGGTSLSDLTQPAGSYIDPVKRTTTKAGYTFDGWYDNDTLVDLTNMPGRNMTVTAHWLSHRHYVSFYSDNSVIKEDLLDYGSPIVKPANPTKTGFTFKGWNPEVQQTVGDTDLRYDAMFNENSTTVTFSSNFGTPTTYEETLTYSSNTLPANRFTRPGYVFSGWATSAEGALVYSDQDTLPADLFTHEENTLSLFAKWEATYTKVTVKHLGENINKDGYILLRSDDLTETYKTGQTTNVEYDTFEGFTASKDKIEQIH